MKTAPNVPVLKVNSISRAKQRKASAFGGRRKLTVGAVVVDNTYEQDDTEITDSMVARGHAGNPATENVVSTTTGASMMLTESTKEPLRGAVNRMPGASRTIRVRKTSQVGQPIIAKNSLITRGHRAVNLRNFESPAPDVFVKGQGEFATYISEKIRPDGQMNGTRYRTPMQREPKQLSPGRNLHLTADGRLKTNSLLKHQSEKMNQESDNKQTMTPQIIHQSPAKFLKKGYPGVVQPEDNGSNALFRSLKTTMGPRHTRITNITPCKRRMGNFGKSGTDSGD